MFACVFARVSAISCFHKYYGGDFSALFRSVEYDVYLRLHFSSERSCHCGFGVVQLNRARKTGPKNEKQDHVVPENQTMLPENAPGVVPENNSWFRAGKGRGNFGAEDRRQNRALFGSAVATACPGCIGGRRLGKPFRALRARPGARGLGPGARALGPGPGALLNNLGRAGAKLQPYGSKFARGSESEAGFARIPPRKLGVRSWVRAYAKIYVLPIPAPFEPARDSLNCLTLSSGRSQ